MMSSILRSSDSRAQCRAIVALQPAKNGDERSLLQIHHDIKALGKNAYFVEDRNVFLQTARDHLSSGTTLLLMGARDPSLEQFGKDVYNQL